MIKKKDLLVNGRCKDCGLPPGLYEGQCSAAYGFNLWHHEACLERTVEQLRSIVAAQTAALAAAAEMRSWYRKQMGPGGPEDEFDAAMAAVVAAKQSP